MSIEYVFFTSSFPSVFTSSFPCSVVLFFCSGAARSACKASPIHTRAVHCAAGSDVRTHDRSVLTLEYVRLQKLSQIAKSASILLCVTVRQTLTPQLRSDCHGFGTEWHWRPWCLSLLLRWSLLDKLSRMRRVSDAVRSSSRDCAAKIVQQNIQNTHTYSVQNTRTSPTREQNICVLKRDHKYSILQLRTIHPLRRAPLCWKGVAARAFRRPGREAAHRHPDLSQRLPDPVRQIGMCWVSAPRHPRRLERAARLASCAMFLASAIWWNWNKMSRAKKVCHSARCSCSTCQGNEMSRNSISKPQPRALGRCANCSSSTYRNLTRTPCPAETEVGCAMLELFWKAWCRGPCRCASPPRACRQRGPQELRSRCGGRAKLGGSAEWSSVCGARSKKFRNTGSCTREC